jgi:hypothetical protein
LKHGINSGNYNVEIICGYKFNRGENVFKEYVEKFYGIKAGTIKSPMGTNTSKLLLNTLYGRLGMDPYKTISIVLPDEKVGDFINNNDVIQDFPLVVGYSFVRYKPRAIIN